MGRNTVLYDDQGNPSIMVIVPLMTEAELLDGGREVPHPAFIVNGVTKPRLYISKYQNFTVGSSTTLRAVGLKHRDPGNTINFDTALLACKQKGAGWHLMTNAEWAAIALWAKKQGFWPRGNNSYGKDINIQTEKGIPSYFHDYGGTTGKRIGRTLTGSGPISRSHDGTPFGIFDLNGNVWEWVGGLRLKIGEIQILENNNAADNTKDQSDTSTEWKAILPDGTLVAPGTNGTYKFDSPAAGTGGTANLGTPILNTAITNSGYPTDPTSNGYYDYNYSYFKDLQIASGLSVANILKLLGIVPIDSNYKNGGLWVRNYGERLPFRGGSWDYGSYAGLFALALFDPRSYAYVHVGFRSAYVNL
ncbi:SUMF1/EgtB/PvdO family nonheme iron enzyme [Caldanaerobacter subterraneus]|uniref:SUMF1/EgtB/PvdO family nonheme iron enzyme n=2 Tax=Caldanaerobacter subterraneus TaxID=911092 RepID=A0A7Y2L8X4_9THEO|nr:SUMF1/EgtB/PvdO family nonheme iron enzyme [Caldanaerobacter subterraneus]